MEVEFLIVKIIVVVYVVTAILMLNGLGMPVFLLQ
jgi:hypothetical protein